MAPERLIDVVKDEHVVLHTFPIEPPEPDPLEARFHEKALSAATHAQLVPAEEANSLSTRNHVSRGGSLEPYGDSHDVLMETKSALENCVREHAYHLWEQAGQSEGFRDEFWHHARDEHFRERAYRLWEYEGRPKAKLTGTGIGRATTRRSEKASLALFRRCFVANKGVTDFVRIATLEAVLRELAGVPHGLGTSTPDHV